MPGWELGKQEKFKKNESYLIYDGSVFVPESSQHTVDKLKRRHEKLVISMYCRREEGISIY